MDPMGNTQEALAEEQGELEQYIDVIKRRVRLIKLAVLICASVAIVGALLQPNIYTSSGTLIPQAQSSGGLADILGGGVSLLLGKGGAGVGSSDLVMFNNILASKDHAGRVVDELKLIEIFQKRSENDINLLRRIRGLFTNKTPTPESEALRLVAERSAAIGQLMQLVEVVYDPGKSMISIAVSDEDPQLAHKIANSYFIQLDKFLNTNSMTMAQATRIFMQGQLEQNKAALSKAENQLRAFQEERDTLLPPKQIELTVMAAADLQTKIAQEELNLNLLRSTSGGSNAAQGEIRSATMRLQELKKQLNTLTFGETFSPLTKSHGKGGMIPLKLLPDVTLEYGRLMRDVTVQSAVFQLLQQQFESAKISEARESMKFILIDQPSLPIRPSSPNRTLIFLVGLMLGVIGGIVAAFLAERHSLRPASSKQKTDSIGFRFMERIARL